MMRFKNRVTLFRMNNDEWAETVGALRDQDPEISFRAANALRAIAANQIGTLVAMLDEPQPVAATALDALIAAIDGIGTALADGLKRSRRPSHLLLPVTLLTLAAQQLTELGRELLDHPDPSVRAHAAEILSGASPIERFLPP